MKICIDMDDVVADWLGWASKMLDIPVTREGDKLPSDIWEQVSQYPRMYRDLPVRTGAELLIETCRKYSDELYFLTAIPKANNVMWASYDKFMWGQQYFPDIPVIIAPFSRNKYQHCTTGDILIDDRGSNCDDWIAAGGLAHRYTEVEPCIEWLSQTLGNK